MGSWMVLEAYNDRYYTTGITYQVENQLTPTTITGRWRRCWRPAHPRASPAVWIGASIAYEGLAFENGGIVGSVFYEVTRNEFDSAVRGGGTLVGRHPRLDHEPVCHGGMWDHRRSLRSDSVMFELAADGSLAKGRNA